jgi:hypothetical protein
VLATAWVIAPLTLALAAGAQVADQGAGETNIVFTVAVRTELNLDLDPKMRVVLWLANLGKQTTYVSPVIGQMCRSLIIRARHCRTDREYLLYERRHSPRSVELPDLFRLPYGRSLELQMYVDYADILTEEGAYDLWAELDCTGMDKVVPQAFAGKLRSNDARFVFTRRSPHWPQ